MTSESRVRRLRWRLTALFALTSTIGLMCLAVFAIARDDASWRNEVDDALTVQTSQTIAMLGYDSNDHLDVSELAKDSESYCPTVTVLSRAGKNVAIAHLPSNPCVRISETELKQLGAAATEEQDGIFTDTTTPQGHPVRMRAESFTSPGGESSGGAVVAAIDTTSYHYEHDQLALWLVVGSLVLVSLSAAVGHLLSGRAVKPALQALQQQEMFLADAAHDLRTPAASLRALAETSLRDESARSSALERTVRLASRMGDLIDGLLTRARLMAGVSTLDREPLRLDQLVEAVVDDTDTAGHQVIVRAESVVVEADSDLLRRAVANLLGNALTHGHQPGAPAFVEITVMAGGTVLIDDAGPGIPPELADSLFERFRSGGGSTGLGLSVASWVAHAHAGTLTVETSPRGGARFILRLGGQRKKPD